MKKIFLTLLVFSGFYLIDQSQVYAQIAHERPPDYTVSNPVHFCILFLKWYVKNENKMQGKPYFNMGENGDTTTVYTVNFKNVNYYVEQLSKSGYFSNDFTHQILIDAHNANNYLTIKPQHDGEVTDYENGIDYAIDPVIQIMEEGLLSDHLNELTGRAITGKSYSVVVVKTRHHLKYIFTLSKKRNKWLIDTIKAIF